MDHALSITNAKDVAADVMDPPPLLPRLPPTPEDVEALRARLRAVPLYRENLVSADGRGAAINVVFKPLSDAEYADLDAAHRGHPRRPRTVRSASTTPAPRT